MLHRAIMAGMCAVLLAEAADPPWKNLGTCLTPQETVCRTLQWEWTGWENVSWGFHAIRRWHGSTILAYSRNGPFIERYSQKAYRNWLVPERQWDTMEIKFPLEQRTIEIDHFSKTYKLRLGVRGGLTVWDSNDSDCAKMAAAFSLKELVREGESTIAGFRSVRYTGWRSKNEREYIWLAPSLGCTQMMVVTSAHNFFGLPASYSHSQVTFIQIGEPDRKLFEVPSGYTQIH